MRGWDEDLRRNDFIREYTRQYTKLDELSMDKFMEEYGYLLDEGSIGCFADFKCENKSLKEIIIEDIMEALRMEFPQNFD